MSDIYTAAQQFASPEEAVIHYGVKGMQWGVRKDDRLEGVPAKTNREASKDAQEFARAKMFYGQGAGTRRKLIKAKVEANSKRDPMYKKAFDHHMAKQDLGKHAAKARGERRRKDVTASTAKTARGVNRSLRGDVGNVTITSAILAGGVIGAKRAGVDTILKDAAVTKYKGYKQKQGHKKAVDDLLKDMKMK